MAVALTALGMGCSADRPRVNTPDAGSAMDDQLQAPGFDPSIPTTTPNAMVAVRGTTDGTRVIVQGGPGDPIVTSSLPGGGFCADVPLMPSGPTTLTAFALKDRLDLAPHNHHGHHGPGRADASDAAVLGDGAASLRAGGPGARRLLERYGR